MSEPARYELVRTIASGGMAHVYEARSRGAGGFERKVAIKRILPEYASIQAVKAMFLDEARIASRLHHGNIVQVLDYGLLDGSELLVMEFVDGLDASRAVDQALSCDTPLPEGLALHVVSEVAHALSYAHTLQDADGQPYGIVHRDVSPHNILLSWDGDVKLADFGIALASDRESKTQTGVVKGKPDFMAPEQLKGERVTAAADVYGLGASLRAMLLPSGDGETEVSEEVTALLEACLHRDAAVRPSADTLARQAGELSRGRLLRDGRGALREWVEGLRAPTSRKVHALDDLMGMALVRTTDGHDFEVSKEQALAPALTEGSFRLPQSRTPRLVGGVMFALLLITLALGVAGAAGVFGEDDGSAAAVVGEGRVELIAPSPRSQPEASEVDAPAPAEELAEGTQATTAEREERSATENDSRLDPHRQKRRTPVVRRVPPAAESTPMQQDVPAQVGWVRIPRASDGQERVWIDGAATGFTPYARSLSVGTHRLRVVDAESGRVLVERAIQVRPVHTRTSPLRVRR